MRQLALLLVGLGVAFTMGCEGGPSTTVGPASEPVVTGDVAGDLAAFERAFMEAGDGALTGTITDTAGAPLEGVVVFVRHCVCDSAAWAGAHRLQDETDEDGSYRIEAIPEGTWPVIARKPRYSRYEELVTFGDDTVVLDITLEPCLGEGECSGEHHHGDGPNGEGSCGEDSHGEGPQGEGPNGDGPYGDGPYGEGDGQNGDGQNGDGQNGDGQNGDGQNGGGH